MQVILQAVFGLYDSPCYSQIRLMLKDITELTPAPLRASLLFFPWFQKDLGPWSPGGQFQRQLRQLDELLYTEIATRRAQLDPNRTKVSRGDTNLINVGYKYLPSFIKSEVRSQNQYLKYDFCWVNIPF